MNDLAPLHLHTPLIHSRAMTARVGAPVWLKLEALQPSASFKLRGIGQLCQRAAAAGERRFVASSGGNAGLAVAYAGRRLGAHVTVVVPETTDELMRDRIAAEGAEVLVHGEVWDLAHQRAMKLVAEQGGTYVPPFDHPEIWQGHATLVEELREQLDAPPGLIVLSVGGGGLLCGVLAGLQRVGWPGVPVLAVETEGAASLAAARAAGQLVELPAIESIATSLGARRVAAEALAGARRHDVRLHQVSDARAVAACLRFADDHRLLVEPACGAALAPLYDRARCTGGAKPIVVVVCGGAGVSRAKLATWAHQLGVDPSA